MSQETINALTDAREYFNKMWNEGFVTGEMQSYQNKVEKVFETLGIKPDYA
jgi:hypothetical protein